MADEWVMVYNASTRALLASIQESEERRWRLEQAHHCFMQIWNLIITRRQTLQMRSLVAGFSGFVVDMQRQLDALPWGNRFMAEDSHFQSVNRRFWREEERLRADQVAFAETLVEARGVLLRFWIDMRYRKGAEVVSFPDAVRPPTYRNRHHLDVRNQGYYWQSFQDAMAACGIPEDEATGLEDTMGALGIAQDDANGAAGANVTTAWGRLRGWMRARRWEPTWSG